MDKVSVVILNYQSKEETLKCVKSVLRSDYSNLEIIMLDNNSDDGLSEEIKKFPGVIFIQNSDNLGYSGGNNIGIKRALKDGADFIFILNMDTTINKNTISELVKSASKERVGVVSPKIMFGDKKTIWYAGGIFDKANVLGSHRGVNEEDHGQYDTEEETDFGTGGAMFVKSDVFKKIGLLDENYFLYYEDADFNIRAKRAGFKIVFCPKALVYHENAKSTGLGSPLQDYYITRNRMILASKFLPWRTRMVLLREGFRNIKIPARRKALFDFLMNNLGKGNI